MPRPRRYTNEMLKTAVESSTTVADVMRKLGIKPAGGSHKHIASRIKKENFSTEHFTGSRHNKGQQAQNRKNWREILSVYPTGRAPLARLLRRALIESGRDYRCEKCFNKGFWENQPLTLEVDHIDGNRQNNVKENLRFLCPNCHSQTKLFSGRKKRLGRRPEKKVLAELLWKSPSTKIGELFGVSDKAVEKWAKSYNLKKPPRGFWAKKKAENFKLGW